MRIIVAFLLLSFCAGHVQAQNVVITFTTPQQFQLTGDNLSISVVVFSTNQIATVKAYAGTSHTILNYNSQNQKYEGNLSLSGLTQDTLVLNVVAADVLNNTDTVSQPVIYDLPPTIFIYAPLNWSNARPTIPIKARCADNGAHCLMTVSANMNGLQMVPLGSFADSVNTTVDLSPFEGNYGYLLFTATDTRNQQVSKSSQIFVESSPYLEQVYAGTDQIQDFNYNKVFITNTIFADTNQNISFIQDITSLDSISVPFISPAHINLTPFGAMITATTDNVSYTNYDFNNDSLYNLGSGSGTYKATGNLAVYDKPDGSIILRDLALKTDTAISPAGYRPSIGYDLADNGTVVYSKTPFDYTYNINKYLGGVTTLISNDNGGTKSNFYPLTDGTLTVYNKQDYSCTCNSSIYATNGSGDILLSNLGNTIITPGAFYQVNNGFVTYSSIDSAGHIQVWLRDSLGNNLKITSFGSDSRLELMDSHGDFTFTSNVNPTLPRRYFAARNGAVENVSSWMGTTYFRNNGYYIALGRTLYKLNVSIPPNRIDSSGIPLSKDSAYHFKTIDFTNQFKGPGQLIKVKITSLPGFGNLTFHAQPVVLNQEIVRSDLTALTYTPNASYIRDSIGWNGSNGITYTGSSGLITLSEQLTPCDSVTPEIKITSNSSTVVGMGKPVILSIISSNGGNDPLYTFAADHSFLTIIEGPSANTTLNIEPSDLKSGNNWYYARMQTSLPCATSSFAIDSININLATQSGLIDPDFPNQPIFEYPNPIGSQIFISGLQPAKSYHFSLSDINGRRILLQESKNATQVMLTRTILSSGAYLLEVYDETKGRMLGTIQLLAN